MTERDDKMVLGSFAFAFGSHPAAWLQPQAPLDAATSLEHWIGVAQLAEKGRFDFLFIADSPAVAPGSLESICRWPNSMNRLEPLTLLAALASHTKHIGLAATVSTSFSEPYNVARFFGSLDHISNGRAAWNVVTSDHQATSYNFGQDGLEPHALRYEKAREFVDVVFGLWDSYDDDAFIRDRESGRYFDPRRLHQLDHKGAHYSVRGPLNLARPPQGRPVIAQAGGSEPGKDLAAETAEVVFTVGASLESCRVFYEDIKGRMAKYGRRPDDMKIMPGMPVFVGETAEEADAKLADLSSRLHPEAALSLLSLFMTGVDFSGLDLDEPVPPSRLIPRSNASQAIFSTAVRLVKEEKITVRQLAQRWAAQGSHTLFKGSVKQVVDEMELWFHSRAADGFIVQHATLPGALTDFVDLVIPELQRRKLFREHYTGATLRENLGIARPPSRYDAAGRADATCRA